MRRAPSANGHLSTPSAPSSSSAVSDPSLDSMEEDMECPLCLEEIDLSDLHFKPCPCGYQICRFCWHHIKENLNGRCPACRTLYTDEAVRFKPMKPDELKRLQSAKKQREKEKKESDMLSAARKPLANVRVKHKSQVHIRGLTARVANEDTLSTLRDSAHYGRFGKIAKIFLSRNATMSGSTHPDQQPVNLYINFMRLQDAAACIHAIDGTYTADGNELRANWGTTKYCTAFLRGQTCNNEMCQQAHELGEEVDVSDRNARQELSSMKHAMKESETKGRGLDTTKADGPGLPASASWGSKIAPSQPSRLQTFVPPSRSSAPSPSSIAPPVSMPNAIGSSAPVLQGPIGRGQRLPRPLQTTVGSRHPPHLRQTAVGRENGVSNDIADQLKASESDFNSAESSDTAVGGPVATTSSLPSTPLAIETVMPSFEDADFEVSSPPIANDFDRTLDIFSNGSFSFIMPADVKGKERAPTDSILKASTRPPPLSMRAALDQIRPEQSPSLGQYAGAFDPFATGFEGAMNDGMSDRRTSRFGFAKAKSLASPTEMYSEANAASGRLGSSYLQPLQPASTMPIMPVMDDFDPRSSRGAPSPFFALSPELLSTAASAPLPPFRDRSSAASMPLPPAGSAHQSSMNMPPGLPHLSRSQGPLSTAAAYALPPTSATGRQDYRHMMSSPPPGVGGQGTKNLFSDPAIAQYGLNNSGGQPQTAAYHSLDHLRASSNLGSRTLSPAQHHQGSYYDVTR